MYNRAAQILEENRFELASMASKWVQTNHPERTPYYDKCVRDVSLIISALELCLRENNTQAIDYVASKFFKWGVLQIKSTNVEFETYDILLLEIEKKLVDAEHGSATFCKELISHLKELITAGVKLTSPVAKVIPDIFVDWEQEKNIIRNMQRCQRNWDYSKTINPLIANFLLWQAENAPSKQHEAYYDVYWSTDRAVIEECSKYTWGSTHNRTPPSTWRNSQSNANMYMVFVAKEPETQLNCHADGTLKPNSHPARWENAYVSIGIALGLVMRAAHGLGLVTGCNKSHGDINGDLFWEKKLGIEDDVKAGKKRIAYGIGIGYPQEGRNRWETDEYELALGAGNGDNLTTLTEDDPDWQEINPNNGRKFRKVKIIDIRNSEERVTDPYGNEHIIPTKSAIKINSPMGRTINVREIK